MYPFVDTIGYATDMYPFVDTIGYATDMYPFVDTIGYATDMYPFTQSISYSVPWASRPIARIYLFSLVCFTPFFLAIFLWA